MHSEWVPPFRVRLLRLSVALWPSQVPSSLPLYHMPISRFGIQQEGFLRKRARRETKKWNEKEGKSRGANRRTERFLLFLAGHATIAPQSSFDPTKSSYLPLHLKALLLLELVELGHELDGPDQLEHPHESAGSGARAAATAQSLQANSCSCSSHKRALPQASSESATSAAER